MDRRVQKTRALIIEAFNRLLLSKNYLKITIQDIIDEANIGRSTFYAHFETKDDLLEALCYELFNHIFSDELKAEETHDFSRNIGELNYLLVHILYHLKDDKKNHKGILVGESSDIFWNYMKQHFSRFITTHILNIQTKDNTLPNDLLIHHISSSFIELVKWWMQNGMKETPEIIEKYFEELIFPIIPGK